MPLEIGGVPNQIIMCCVWLPTHNNYSSLNLSSSNYKTLLLTINQLETTQKTIILNRHFMMARVRKIETLNMTKSRSLQLSGKIFQMG